MKNILKDSRSKIFSIAMAFVMAVGINVPSTVAFAAEAPNVQLASATIKPLSGVETLPMGTYDIGGFTFTDTNLTPVKTVTGSQIALGISFRKASSDAGIGNVKLTVQIRDTNGNALSPAWVYTADPEAIYTYVVTPKVNLGYSGRKIQIWFDASSAGQSNGNYRSIQVTHFYSFVS